MQYTIIQLRGFEVTWKSLRLTDEDLQALEAALMLHPEVGAVMRGSGGLRKVRFAPPSRGKGKSGSLRVCYAAYPDYGRIYLVDVFKKNEKDNLTAAERNEIRNLLNRLRRGLARGENP